MEKNKKFLKRLNVFTALAVALLVYLLVWLWFCKDGRLCEKKYYNVVKNYFSAVGERNFDKYIGCFDENTKKEYILQKQEKKLSDSEYMQWLYSDFSESYGKDYNVLVEIVGDKQEDNFYIVTANVIVEGNGRSDKVTYNCYVCNSGKKYYIANIEDISEIA